MLEIEIDGKTLTVPDGSTIMDAAHQCGTYIPHFCYHKKLSIAANCRMCLVEVEKAPKPLPACATPVTPGMKVQTHSPMATKAQKGVMEFLLINHPLDCPICDQGGECQLQDLAVGYGAGASRYQEEKRVVVGKDMGPLVSAEEMSRCIHCTRCVRFTEEIGGFQEIGMANRGEHSEILPFLNKTVDSEISGNVIDLCPVGALTSKPFRYSARPWELSRRKSVSPHDGLGSNLIVQVKQGQVMRVLPRENESINECWISDRDRFSYEALNSSARLTAPRIKQGGEWKTVDWQTALDYVAHGLQCIAKEQGADKIGALVSPHSTLEELYLTQKMLRGMGIGNIDSRLRQADFSGDALEQGAPWLGVGIDEVAKQNAILLVGSNIRKEQPLLATRVRAAVRKGAQLSVIGVYDEDMLCKVAAKTITAPAALPSVLAAVLKAVAESKGAAVPAHLADAVAAAVVDAQSQQMAGSLISGETALILLGDAIQQHPQYAAMRQIAQALADIAGAKLAIPAAAANSVGGYIAGSVPHKGALGVAAKTGLNAAQMLAAPLKAYLLLNTDIESDCNDGAKALATLNAADMVVYMSPFSNAAAEQYADVMLPVSPFTETSGSFINTTGLTQSFNGVVKPLGETRPAWKVLRVLANLLQLPGFDYVTSEAVRDELLGDGSVVATLLDNTLTAATVTVTTANGLQRIGDVPLYQADQLVRRAESLQLTKDAGKPAASMSAATLAQLGVTPGARVKVSQSNASVTLVAEQDDRVADGCVRVIGGHAATNSLGALFGAISVERA
ncbi:MAG: NADH-quinone oxidoreductase subunit NuoG [Chitinivorax sp.]